MKTGVPGALGKVSFPMKPDGDWGETWDSIIEKTEPIKEMVERTPDEIATIIYTSGTSDAVFLIIIFCSWFLPRALDVNSKPIS